MCAACVLLQDVAEGAVIWPPPLEAQSRFAVLPGVAKAGEISSILSLLNEAEISMPFDADPDTVDGMTSHEIFVENDDLRAFELTGSRPRDGSMKLDSQPAHLEERRPLRQALLKIMRRAEHSLHAGSGAGASGRAERGWRRWSPP